jgi:non-canonical (house-cleaning) NTP pyrophosphatase
MNNAHRPAAAPFSPPAVAELIREGKELGEADDPVFGRSNSGREWRGGHFDRQ